MLWALYKMHDTQSLTEFWKFAAQVSGVWSFIDILGNFLCTKNAWEMFVVGMEVMHSVYGMVNLN